jgi:ubiquinone/menaquinone biosynthesis C-methylase UbiE
VSNDRIAGSSANTGARVREYFDTIAGDWDQMRAGYFGEAVRDEIARRLDPRPEWIVADVGSGTGFVAAALAGRVAELHCVDASGEMLAVAQQRLGDRPGMRFHQAPGDRLPFADGSLDGVVANMYLHHAPDPAAALHEMTRVLRPGGKLVLTDLDTHTEDWMRAEMADVWLGFDRQQVREWLLAAGLADVDIDGCGQDCRADRPCGGRAAISIFVAEGRKAG